MHMYNTDTHMCVWIHIYTYICIYIYVHIYVSTHTHTRQCCTYACPYRPVLFEDTSKTSKTSKTLASNKHTINSGRSAPACSSFISAFHTCCHQHQLQRHCTANERPSSSSANHGCDCQTQHHSRFFIFFNQAEIEDACPCALLLMVRSRACCRFVSCQHNYSLQESVFHKSVHVSCRHKDVSLGSGTSKR